MATTSIMTTAPMSSVRVEAPSGIRARNTPRIPFRTIETPVDYKDCFDSELVIKGFKFGYKAWKVKGKAQNDWQSLRGALQTYLMDNKPKILQRLPLGYKGHLSSPYKLDCYLVGQRQTHALPRVAVCCGELNYAKAIRLSIVESGLLGGGSYPHFSACFVIVAHVSQYMDTNTRATPIVLLGEDGDEQIIEKNSDEIDETKMRLTIQRKTASQIPREKIFRERRERERRERERRSKRAMEKKMMEKRADKLIDKRDEGHIIDEYPLISIVPRQRRNSISTQREEHLPLRHIGHSPREQPTGHPSLSQDLTYVDDVLNPYIDLSDEINLEKDKTAKWTTKKRRWPHYDPLHQRAATTYNLYAAGGFASRLSFVGGVLCLPGSELKRTTIGGLVQIGDNIFAMTVFHSLREDLEIYPPTTNSSEAFILDWEDMELPTSECLPDPAEILSSPDSMAYPELSYPSSHSVSELPKLPVFSDLHWRCEATLAIHGIGTDPKTELDWALLSINEDDCGPGLINISHDAQNIPLIADSITYKDAAELASVILTTAHGTLVAVGASSTASIKVPGIETFQNVWSIQCKGVMAGDCGSWVFEESTKCLVGMVIAASPALNEVYILPMKIIFQDLEEQFGETPSLFIY